MPASISKILETNINAAISKRKITHTGGLPQDVTLITNKQYDLISNIDVEDGLINGAQCIIKYIQTTQKNDDIFPYIVWAEFENKDIGTNFRKKYAYLYSTQTNRQWTPIIKIKRNLLLKTTGFIGYNFHYVRQLHVQYMFHKVLHIQKYMLT